MVRIIIQTQPIRASQETDMALELRNRDRDRKLVKRIDITLKRLHDD